MLNLVPPFMHPDYSLISSLEDLLFQIEHEIDLAEEGELDWKPWQIRRAKLYVYQVKQTAKRQNEI